MGENDELRETLEGVLQLWQARIVIESEIAATRSEPSNVTGRPTSCACLKRFWTKGSMTGTFGMISPTPLQPKSR